MRLVRGEGSEGEGACWMSALHFYTRKDSSWTDYAPWACVSPIVRLLCINLNDLCDDGEREALIGPHLFTPLGTAGSVEDEGKRSELVRRFNEAWLEEFWSFGPRDLWKKRVLALILECCAIGEKREVAPTCSREEVLAVACK